MREYRNGTFEPDLDEARRWLENVIAQVEGRVARAEGVAAVRAAIRSVVDDINVREVLDDQDRPPGAEYRALLIAITLREDALAAIAVETNPDEPSSLGALLAGNARQ